ncbi:ADA15 protein, partial [Vireo altiloquus]|nr:ADA15 protein [Vireo altiloquus]
GACAGDSSQQHSEELRHSWSVTPWVLSDNRTLSLAEATQGGFPARLRVLLELEGTRLVLELEQNWELVQGTGALLYYLPDGARVIQEPSEQEHCCYQGTVQGFPSSWASLCACAGLSGHLWLSETRSYALEPDTSSPPGQPMASHLRVVRLEPQSCGQGPHPGAEATEPLWPQRVGHPGVLPHRGCPHISTLTPLCPQGKRAAAEQRFVELVMVVDHAAVSAGQCTQNRDCPFPCHPSDPSPRFPSSRITPTCSAFA